MMRRRPVQLTKELQGDRIDTNTFVSQVRKLAVCIILHSMHQSMYHNYIYHIGIYKYSIHLSIYISIHLSIHLFIYLSIPLSIRLSIHPSTHQLINPNIYTSIYLTWINPWSLHSIYTYILNSIKSVTLTYPYIHLPINNLPVLRLVH